MIPTVSRFASSQSDKPGPPARRIRRNEQAGHQPVHFLLRKQYIPNKQTDETGGLQGQCSGKMQNWPWMTDLSTYQIDQCIERIGFRASYIEKGVFLAVDRLDGDLRQILRINRLKFILAVSELSEKGEAPQNPGDVIDQDILFPEN